jgi:hypothetical protein
MAKGLGGFGRFLASSTGLTRLASEAVALLHRAFDAIVSSLTARS